MNAKVYKWCAVPQCTNSSLKTPDKVFVYVPNEKTMRFKWLTLARRDPKAINVDSSIYFCEDHFDLPNDMDNYMEYHIMGSVAKIRMKPGCIPTRFDCQPDRRKRASAETIHRPYITKKQRQDIIQESIKDLEEKSIINKPLELEETSVGCSAVRGDEVIENITQEKDKTANKSIQVYMTHKFRSKAVQSGVKIVNQMTSPLKQDRQSVSTSPFKITRCTSKIKPTTSNIHISSRKIFVDEAQSDSDISYTPSIMDEGTSQTISVQTNSTSDCSELLQDDKQKEAALMLQCTLLKINRNPRCYIGVPKDCHYLLGLIEEYTNIPPVHFLMCLKKIRLNNSFRELADDFSMTPSYASKIFLKNVPLLASVMRAFIVKLDKYNIKNNLPMAFRHKYYHVSCIIDCLEIEIQKPSKAVNQSLSWSEYKKANTIKYLISCTPNGLVNFISPGYGGRVTDTCLVESCDFIKCLQPSMCVMADRGFKHVESYLLKQGVKLVRPPSVVKGSKLSKTEVRETKQIASLRIHIERVIRRLREFSLLKPHACVNHNLVRVLDDSITIACGLINLQDSLIK
ncbi:uncharacterized protein LOC125237175 isoform X1 [Leguminivora glycinivorella]|uniref:uncharacterized protein LOC125237175 isoform X1 n=2 Tax=Leguminivora glycinivorella TaxID=1035111 RepID=UPI002010355B|nr:uncharacterized protein LOC125237175 isoform X1 [Leguminivora glycinivorella]